jgi:hypothetical protein
VGVEGVLAGGWQLGGDAAEVGIQRHLRVDGDAAAAWQPNDQIGSRGTVVLVGGEVALRVEVEVFDEPGGLDDLAERGLPPPSADAGAAQGLGELSRLAHELLLLPDERPDQAAELACLAPGIET